MESLPGGLDITIVTPHVINTSSKCMCASFDVEWLKSNRHDEECSRFLRLAIAAAELHVRVAIVTCIESA